MFILFLVLSLFFDVAYPTDEFKFRARESYEVIQVEDESGEKTTYRGLSNTINFFSETPLKHSYGLAFGSIFSGFKTGESNRIELPEEFQVYFLGLEGKYFPFAGTFVAHSFVRGGGYWGRIISERKHQDRKGGLLYFGAGHEFFVSEKVTLCPEIGYKIGSFDRLKNYRSQVISIALHFYVL